MYGETPPVPSKLTVCPNPIETIDGLTESGSSESAIPAFSVAVN